MAVKLKISREKLRALLQEAVEQGGNLLAASGDVELVASGYASWDKRNEQILEAAFETTGFLASGPKQEYLSFAGLNYPFSLDMAKDVTVEGLIGDIKKKIERLSMISQNSDLYDLTPSQAQQGSNEGRNGVFIIHGRDAQSRLEVENLIRRATDHPPIVLQEMVNQGATIIEKLEEHLGQTARFSIVILTGDDYGGLAGDELTAPRARQNVVLELGFAMATLGRRNVTILYQSGVEIPSDISGVAYWELDSAGAWKTRVLGDMRAAGLVVDPGALLG